jgi:hypothetical protein
MRGWIYLRQHFPQKIGWNFIFSHVSTLPEFYFHFSDKRSCYMHPTAVTSSEVLSPSRSLYSNNGAVQCSAVQCSAVQCSAVQCSAVRDGKYGSPCLESPDLCQTISFIWSTLSPSGRMGTWIADRSTKWVSPSSRSWGKTENVVTCPTLIGLHSARNMLRSNPFHVSSGHFCQIVQIYTFPFMVRRQLNNKKNNNNPFHGNT